MSRGENRIIPAYIKIARRDINNLRYADDTTLTAESEEELKSLLMKVKEESEKVDLKLSIQKTKIMASGPITSWEIDGETVEIVSDLIFLDSKITADGDCTHEIKSRLLLGRKALTNLDSILKSRDIAFLPKSKRFLISWLQSFSTVILEHKKIKCVTVSTFSSAMILVIFMLNFKPAFLLSSFTIIKRLFSFSLLSAIKVLLFAYLKLLFLPGSPDSSL